MALADRDVIMAYSAEDDLAAALALDWDCEAHADRARETPTLYKPGRVKGTRENVVRPNDVMVYRAGDATVAMPRVLHATQQWPPAGKSTAQGEGE